MIEAEEMSHKDDIWVQCATGEVGVSGVGVVIALLNFLSPKVRVLHGLQAGVQDGAPDCLQVLPRLGPA